MLRSFLKNARVVLLVVGVFVSMFFVAESIRVYQVFYSVHAFFGVLFLIVFLGCLGWLFRFVFKAMVSSPPVLVPPNIGSLDKLKGRELKRYVKYLIKYLGRLSANENLSDEDKAKAGNTAVYLRGSLKAEESNEIRIDDINKAEEQIEVLLGKLDDKAKGQVRRSTRDIMVAVTLSPYKAADLMIVLYRNLLMTTKIIRIYNSRPRFREQLKIIIDIITVVVTINYINMGKSLLEGLGAKVPVVGKYIDDIAQGIGAGFMTSVAGNAAMQRCRAFKAWSVEEAEVKIHRNLRSFLAEVNYTFKNEVFDLLGKRMDIAKETLDRVKEGVSEVLDNTVDAVDRFVKQPIAASAAAGSEAVRKGSSYSWDRISDIGRGFSRHGKKGYDYTRDKAGKAGRKIADIARKTPAAGKRSWAFAKDKATRISSKVGAKFKRNKNRSSG